MDTKTLAESLEDFHPNNKMASRQITTIFSVYGESFSKPTVVSMFDVPAQVEWVKREHRYSDSLGREKKTYTWDIRIDGVEYSPNTISDFVSLISCLKRINLTPKFEGNESVASILWKRRQ